jgi:hypothetical protein
MSLCLLAIAAFVTMTFSLSLTGAQFQSLALELFQPLGHHVLK